jgi:hypothetical protein
MIPSTYKINLDPQSPAEQNLTIKFKNDTSKGYFSLKEWNGIDINSTVYRRKIVKSNDVLSITIPAGKNTFLFDLKYTFSSQYSSTTYKMDNVELQYLFEAGKKYEIKGKYKSLGFLKGYEFYVQLWETTKKAEMLKEWMVGKS